MFKPLNGRVVVRPEGEAEMETEMGLILLADPLKNKPLSGFLMHDHGELKEGERVVFSKFGFDEVRVNNETLYLVSESALLGVFHD